MNQITTYQQPRGIQLPTVASELMSLARELSTARTIPQAFQKSPADCYQVLTISSRFGFDFYPTIWECSIIKGRLFFSGKMVAAMLNASGFLAERLNYEYSGEGDGRTITVTGRLTSETAPRNVVVKLTEVRTENENWRKQTDQQLSYAGARIWGRRHLPEVLLGMLFEGEVIDVTPTQVMTHSAPILQQTDMSSAPPIDQPYEPPENDAETGEVGPRTLAVGDGGWRAWAQMLIAYIRRASTDEEADRWVELNNDAMLNMREEEPKMHRLLDSAITEARKGRASNAH